MDKDYKYFRCIDCHYLVVRYPAFCIPDKKQHCRHCNGLLELLESFGKFKGIEIERRQHNTTFVCRFENCKVSNCDLCVYFGETTPLRCDLLNVECKNCDSISCIYMCSPQYIYLIDKMKELTGQEIPYICCHCKGKKKREHPPLLVDSNIRWAP